MPGVVKPFYRDAFRPVLRTSPPLVVTKEQADLIAEVLETACSDSRFAQKAYDAIWYILTHGVDPVPEVMSLSPNSGVTLTPVSVAVTGKNFDANSKVIFGGVEQITVFTSPTSVSTDVLLGAEGSYPVAVQGSSGVLSNSQPFTVTPIAGRSTFEEKKLEEKKEEKK